MFSGHGGTGAVEARKLGQAILDASAGIAPFAAPVAARRAYRQAAADLGHYPEIAGASLRQALAAAWGLSADSVLVGAGATEFIYLIPRALRPGRVLSFVPTYQDYAEAARLAQCPWVPLVTVGEQAFARDLAQLASAVRPGDLIFLGNPNNPTGHLLAPEPLAEFAGRYPQTTLVVDEAYLEFVGAHASCLKDLRPPNLLVLRSPTKFYALPGLRLGYCLGHPQLIAALLDAKEPWTASAPALAAGLALLESAAYDACLHNWLARDKPAWERELAAIPGLTVYPSAANFLLCRIQAASPSATRLRAACLQRGLLIRDASNFEGLDGHYFRVALRAGAENNSMVRIIREVLAEG